MPHRPAIPIDVQRAVFFEAGHRCAVCGTPFPLERAHLVPWSRSNDHSAENFICLCANCHERADNDWDVKTLAKYKKNPWVLRHPAGNPAVTETTSVEITISLDFLEFDDLKKRLLRYALASFLEIHPDSVQVRRVKSGSVKVSIELPRAAASRLIAAFESRDAELRKRLEPLQLDEAKLEPQIINEINVFAVTPFSGQYEKIWGAMRECVDKINISASGNIIKIYRASETTPKDILVGNVFQKINDYDIAIIDVTGQVPNIMFALGYAFAANNRIIALCQERRIEPATDYRSFIYTQYDPEDLITFKAQLRTRLLEQINIVNKEREQRITRRRIMADKDVMEVNCFRNREVAKLEEKFRAAKHLIRVLTTNLNAIHGRYTAAIESVLENNPQLNVQFLALDPESVFAAARAKQLGKDTYAFRAELHEALSSVYNMFSKFRNVEIRTYDDLPTQIAFQIDDLVYNSVVSKYQLARDNCIFEVDAKYPIFNTSFSLNFASVWRDPNTTHPYVPKQRDLETSKEGPPKR